MKKLMALVLSLFLLCGMVTAGWAETGEEASAGEQVTYTYQLKADGTAELTGVSDEQLNHMDIPAEVEGHKVTSIGVFAFGNCSSVLSVSIPEGVKTVEPHAFANSFELKSVSIPDSLESIGNSAFRSKRLTEIILSPDHPVYAVENEALIDKRDMSLVQFLAPENTGTYVVEPGITKIREDAFQFARVSAILIPDSVTSIGAMAFTNCENLKSINIPDSVTEMGNDVFSGCDSLTSIQISPYHPKFECVDLVMVKKDTKEMFAASGALQGKYVIPGDIRSIADGAFQWCMYLEEIYIPETVQEIGEYAFSNNYVIRVCEGSAAERYCEQAADRVRHTVMSLEDFTEAAVQLEKEPAFKKAINHVDMSLPSAQAQSQVYTNYVNFKIAENRQPQENAQHQQVNAQRQQEDPQIQGPGVGQR